MRHKKLKNNSSKTVNLLLALRNGRTDTQKPNQQVKTHIYKEIQHKLEVDKLQVLLTDIRQIFACYMLVSKVARALSAQSSLWQNLLWEGHCLTASSRCTFGSTAVHAAGHVPFHQAQPCTAHPRYSEPVVKQQQGSRVRLFLPPLLGSETPHPPGQDSELHRCLRLSQPTHPFPTSFRGVRPALWCEGPPCLAPLPSPLSFTSISPNAPLVPSNPFWCPLPN